MRDPEEFDIARSIREIEALKAGLLAGVSEVYQLMQDAGSGRDALGEALAGIVFSSMELAGRVGVSIEDLDRRVTRRMRAHKMSAGSAQ